MLQGMSYFPASSGVIDIPVGDRNRKFVNEYFFHFRAFSKQSLVLFQIVLKRSLPRTYPYTSFFVPCNQNEVPDFLGLPVLEVQMTNLREKVLSG